MTQRQPSILPAKCGNKRASTGKCIKAKGHVGMGDKRHTDGKYTWGKWW